MLPSLIGIIASSGGAAAGGDYESISTVTVGSGGASSISFSSIPSTYKHLQVRILGKATASAYLKITFNGASTNFDSHYLDANGSSVSSGFDAATSFISNYGAIANTTANVFGVAVIDLLDYANTNKYKTMRSLSGTDYNGSGGVDFTSGLWQSTSAISQIDFTLNTGNFAQYSSFALYGIKG